MDVVSALWQSRLTLVTAFHDAILVALNAAWSNCRTRGAKPHEPDLVASLVLDATPFFHHSLDAALAPYRLSSSICAVFCHQSPMVKLRAPGKGSCELGDILFAYSHRPLTRPIRRNALLLQAKATAHLPHVVGKKEAIQLSLYEEWPSFIYTRPSLLSGQARTVLPGAPHTGAQYLLLDDRPPEDPNSGLTAVAGAFPAGCCIPAQSLYIHAHLAAAIFDLLIGVSGRPFVDKSSSSADWSQVVWDILTTGLTNAFNRKNSGRASAPRHAGAPLAAIDGVSVISRGSASTRSIASEALGSERAEFLYRFDDSPDRPDTGPKIDNDDGGGVSIVLIETAEHE